MRRTLIILLLLALAIGGIARAHQNADPRASQISAATSNAVARLRADIADEKLGQGITVERFLDLTDGNNELTDALYHASPVGGPRWVDEQTCQVKLAIPATDVLKVLTHIAAGNGLRSPLPAEAITQRLKGWDDRTFVATGSSVASDRVEFIKGPESGAWQRVDDAARKRAVDEARLDAIKRVVDSVRSIDLSPAQTVGDALTDPTIKKRFDDWLLSRPATGVSFRDDLTLELTLAINHGELFDGFERATRGLSFARMPDDKDAVAKLNAEFNRHAVAPIGHAQATATPLATKGTSQVIVPTRTPEWAKHPIDVDATMLFAGSKLKTARLAENKAMEKLRAGIYDLPLDDKMNLGEAAQLQPAIDRAINTALSRVRPLQVGYQPDGSVIVRIRYDPRDLWDQLQQLQ